MRLQFVLVGVALLLSSGALFVAVVCWLSLSRLRKRTSFRSARSLGELTTQVADLQSLFKLLQAQQKKFAARTGGRPPGQKEVTPSTTGDWKKRARAQLQANIANKRPLTEGINAED